MKINSGCLQFRFAFVAIAACMFAGSPLSLVGSSMHAQETARKLRTGAPPEYPELAKKWNLKGLARVQVTIAPNGTVMEVDELGGNPVLLDALVRAVKKWKYTPGGKEQLEVRFVFTPNLK